MKGFFIKKAFFDGWDNLIGMVLFNIGYLAIAMVFFYGFVEMGAISPMLSYLVLAVLLLLLSILMGGTAAVTKNYSDYSRETWAAFKEGVKRNIRHSLLFFLFMLLFVVNILFVIPFYSSYGNAFGFVISIIMIWVEIILLLCLPYYFPLMNLLPADRPLKTAKKCFIIVADNLGFTLFYLIYSIICIVISVLTIGLVPGLTGMQLAAQDAMKLLMFKYDYLEENPSADRKHIPWEDLLYDEREKVGPRSLKSMIFPWKY